MQYLSRVNSTDTAPTYFGLFYFRHFTRVPARWAPIRCDDMRRSLRTTNPTLFVGGNCSFLLPVDAPRQPFTSFSVSILFTTYASFLRSVFALITTQTDSCSESTRLRHLHLNPLFLFIPLPHPRPTFRRLSFLFAIPSTCLSIQYAPPRPFSAICKTSPIRH